MGWLAPKEMQRRPGTPGVIVILADVTPSISHANRSRICDEAMKILSARPRARLLAFGERVVDITGNPSRMTEPTLWDCFDWEHWGDAGDDWRRRNGTEGTFIGKALAVAAQSNPEETIVLSDGATADKREMFRIADQMTGIIHAYFCEPRREEYQLDTHYATKDEMWSYFSRGADKAAMQELARRGGGTFDIYPSKRGIYSDYGIREGHAMRQKMPGGNVYINGPGAQRHVIYEDHYITRQRRFFYEDAPDEHVNAQPPQDVHIDMEPTQVQHQQGQAVEYHHAPSFLSWIIKGPPKAQPQALPSPQRGNEEYRGVAQAVPSPTRAPALPAPARSPNGAADEGRQAFHAGAHPPHNPYPPSDGRHGAWLQGWVDESRKRGALPNHSGQGQGLVIATTPRQRTK